MIGLAMVYGRTVKPALAASCAWAAAIWIAGEGFGSILTSTANPLTGALGAALLYTVAGLMMWPRQTDGEPVGRLAWATLWPASAALWSMPANDSAGSVPDAVTSARSGAGWLTPAVDLAVLVAASTA